MGSSKEPILKLLIRITQIRANSEEERGKLSLLSCCENEISCFSFDHFFSFFGCFVLEALQRLNLYLLNLSYLVKEEFFPWVPTALCDYINPEHCRGKASIRRSALVMQPYPQTPSPKGFSPPQEVTSMSVYYGLEFLADYL